MSKQQVTNHIIISPQETEELVVKAGKVYLRECPCRLEVQACPREKWEVCMLFEHASEKDRQQAKVISVDEAVRIVRMTTERGDVHQVFYFQDGMHPYELCNCCTCCCFPLREAKEKGNYAEQLHCGYVAITDADSCIGCGWCLDSCFFEARQLQDGTVHVVDERCFGCGRCIASCPEDAIRLEFQAGRGIGTVAEMFFHAF